MIMVLESVLRQIHLTRGVADAISLGAGFAKGYFNAQGLDINPEILETSVGVAPLVIKGVVGAYVGLCDGISDEDHVRPVSSAVKGGAFGLAVGALEMAIGYCIGYTLGGFSK